MSSSGSVLRGYNTGFPLELSQPTNNDRRQASIVQSSAKYSHNPTDNAGALPNLPELCGSKIHRISLTELSQKFGEIKGSFSTNMEPKSSLASPVQSSIHSAPKNPQDLSPLNETSVDLEHVRDNTRETLVESFPPSSEFHRLSEGPQLHPEPSDSTSRCSNHSSIVEHPKSATNAHKHHRRKKNKKSGKQKPKKTQEASAKSLAQKTSDFIPLEAFCKPIDVLKSPPKKTLPNVPKMSNGLSTSTTLKFRLHNNNVLSNKFTSSSSLLKRSFEKTPRPASEMHQDEGNVAKSIGHRITKVYLSERQSNTVKELGAEVPCAPPVTPLPGTQQLYQYVPSLVDIRAQRAIQTKLMEIEKVKKQKQEKINENKMKMEKLQQKEIEEKTKHRQRIEIYALNKMMTELERKNFEDYCAKNAKT